MPVSEGMVTLGGPSERTTVTVVPSFSEVPAAGLCATMSPAAIAMDCTLFSDARTFMCTLDADARAASRVSPLIAGTGCDGVKTLASKAAASPPATRSTTTATAPTIQARRCERFSFFRGGGGVPAPPACGSASKISPGPARVPTGAVAATVAVAVPVPTVPAVVAVVPVVAAAAAAVAAATSVSSATPGARNPLIGAVAPP